jgi:hypothetical protein
MTLLSGADPSLTHHKNHRLSPNRQAVIFHNCYGIFLENVSKKFIILLKTIPNLKFCATLPVFICVISSNNPIENNFQYQYNEDDGFFAATGRTPPAPL